jgi:glycosyltransferase involved in cell wall biosynthesis
MELIIVDDGSSDNSREFIESLKGLYRDRLSGLSHYCLRKIEGNFTLSIEEFLLFSTGDINDPTAKMLLAVDNPELRLEFGRKARESVQAHSMSGAVAAYVATLEEIIHRR